MPELAGRVADAFEAQVREHEERWLSPLAVRSYETRGRLRDEDDCRLRTPFQRDRDRILHSKPFRRLKGKTQVFIDPAGDHYRTRMTHTLETTAIARGVARALRLNDDLVEAVGLGHDMGHPPFGHAGEEALDLALRDHYGRSFRHNEQSSRIAETLNLTEEVRDGILTHAGPTPSCTIWSKAPSGPGTSCRARRSAAPCWRSGSSCSSVSISARTPGSSRSGHGRRCAASSITSSSVERSPSRSWSSSPG